ncbi:hypothetical protein K8R30_03095 [archaeon]|nr:hypothetical protein [archaeon]
MVKVETQAAPAVATPATSAPAEAATTPATPATPAAVPAKEGGSKMWLWMGIVAAVIVVAGLAYWLLI